jgi:hypothetical protein
MEAEVRRSVIVYSPTFASTQKSCALSLAMPLAMEFNASLAILPDAG